MEQIIFINWFCNLLILESGCLLNRPAHKTFTINNIIEIIDQNNDQNYPTFIFYGYPEYFNR